jgi:hypothetical protein
MESKTCIRCSTAKSIEEFTFPKRKVPIGNACKDCEKAKSKAEYQKRREMHLAYRKEYYEKNKEIILAKTKTDEFKIEMLRRRYDDKRIFSSAFAKA